MGKAHNTGRGATTVHNAIMYTNMHIMNYIFNSVIYTYTFGTSSVTPLWITWEHFECFSRLHASVLICYIFSYTDRHTHTHRPRHTLRFDLMLSKTYLEHPRHPMVSTRLSITDDNTWGEFEICETSVNLYVWQWFNACSLLCVYYSCHVFTA